MKVKLKEIELEIEELNDETFVSRFKDEGVIRTGRNTFIIFNEKDTRYYPAKTYDFIVCKKGDMFPLSAKAVSTLINLKGEKDGKADSSKDSPDKERVGGSGGVSKTPGGKDRKGS